METDYKLFKFASLEADPFPQKLSRRKITGLFWKHRITRPGISCFIRQTARKSYLQDSCHQIFFYVQSETQFWQENALLSTERKRNDVSSLYQKHDCLDEWTTRVESSTSRTGQGAVTISLPALRDNPL
jgi:hypothetical protein